MTNSSRRFFLGSGVLLSLTGIFGLLPFLAKGSRKQEKMFVHHVFFWLKNPESAQDKAKLLEGLKSLKAIKQIRQVHIGEPALTNRGVIDSSYSLSWLVLFNNSSDEEVYQAHPIHLKFVENYAHLWSKVVVYDSADV